jgi:hypothetical protein
MNLHDLKQFLDVFFGGGHVARRGRGLLGDGCYGYENDSGQGTTMAFHKDSSRLSKKAGHGFHG